MKKTSELPQAVNNLRAIWDKKKVEMQFTQVEAAKELGWSQGAISHYLNNITDLGPAATIKFANFLGVSPVDIDPSVVEHLPNVDRYEIARDTADLTKKINRTIYTKKKTTTNWVAVSKGTRHFEDNLSYDWSENMILSCSDVSDAPNAHYFLVVKKGEKQAHVYHKEILPPPKNIKTKLAINSFEFLEGKFE